LYHSSDAIQASYRINHLHLSFPSFLYTIFISQPTASWLFRRILTSSTVKSSATIPKSVDKAMDKANPSNGNLNAGISIRNGPVVEKMDVDEQAPATNGTSNGKRKSRGSIQKKYKEATSSEDDDIPLVRWNRHFAISPTDSVVEQEEKDHETSFGSGVL
jgi:hypothetical protein